jgi:hypothetical protein
LASTPHAARLAQLSAREQYTAVELFRGTMLRHSAIIYRDDNPHKAQANQFENAQWPSYIPHRLPNTITVTEKLPQGAAAVLINQNHTYPDIYLPINQEEKRMVEAINGRRTITEIGRCAAVNNSDRLRAFFRKLWWHDQVIFEVPE